MLKPYEATEHLVPWGYGKAMSLDHNALFALIHARSGRSADEAAAIAHALVDIQEATTKLYDELVPKLLAGADLAPADFDELLADIGDEFRHMAYHITDSRLAGQEAER